MNADKFAAESYDALWPKYERLKASHEELLEACKFAFQKLKPNGNVKKDYSGHLAMATLSQAIFKAKTAI